MIDVLKKGYIDQTAAHNVNNLRMEKHQLDDSLSRLIGNNGKAKCEVNREQQA